MGRRLIHSMRSKNTIVLSDRRASIMSAERDAWQAAERKLANKMTGVSKGGEENLGAHFLTQGINLPSGAFCRTIIFFGLQLQI